MEINSRIIRTMVFAMAVIGASHLYWAQIAHACSDGDRTALKSAGFGACAVEQICTSRPTYMESELQLTPTQVPNLIRALKAKGCENVAVIQQPSAEARAVASSKGPEGGPSNHSYMLVAKNCTLVARGYACPLGSDVQTSAEGVISDMQMDICALKNGMKGSEQLSSFGP